MFASICQIITLAFVNNPSETGLMYFSIACAFILLNLMSYFFMTKMKFASYNRKNDSLININSTENEESTPLVNNSKKNQAGLKFIKQTFKQVSNQITNLFFLRIFVCYFKCAFFLVTIFFIYVTSFSIYPGVAASVKSTSTSRNKFSSIFLNIHFKK
jgi:hypothetical protein